MTTGMSVTTREQQLKVKISLIVVLLIDNFKVYPVVCKPYFKARDTQEDE